jgi:hypothetical protein
MKTPLPIRGIELPASVKPPKTQINGISSSEGSVLVKQVGQRKPNPMRKPRSMKNRRQRCDCGRLAVKVLLVRVGSDPQYTVHLPLCRDCLKLEYSLHETD